MDDRPGSFLKALVVVTIILAIHGTVASKLKCGPYPPPTTINSWALNKTIHVKMKEELSKPYGYCWIHKNFAVQNVLQYTTHCKFETWNWLTVNSQSKARKLAKFGRAAKASLNSDTEYETLFYGMRFPPSSRNYTSDLICLDTIEYNEAMKTHVWTHSKQKVSFQAFDPTDIVYKGNSCVSFNMTSEKWRFDPWCIHLCTPVCQQKGPGVTFSDEQPDNMPIYTPPSFDPAKCSGNFLEKTPTHSELEQISLNKHWRFYPDEKFGFGYLFPNGYGYCWALHMSKQINEDEGGFLKCEDLYPHSKGVAVNSKMKVEKLSNYGRGMQEYIWSKGIKMETGRLSSVVTQDDQLVWESTGQPVNWTLFASEHNHSFAKEMVCPYISWKQRTLHSAGGICTGDVLICEQSGHDYPDETPVVQGFTEWSEWSSCQASCGQGVQVKARECMGSYVCEGKAREVTNCTAGPCPVEGGFTDWSEWSHCSASCGQGSQSRSRNCSNTDPNHGGANCHGDYEETQECEGPPCASMAHTVNGSFTHWSEWSQCSASCGQGSQSRSRNCSNTDPHHGGANCHGDTEETQECEGPPCASMAHTVNGSFTHWSEWSHCSASCGQGSQSRSRNCSDTDPHHGGANCHGDTEETQDCEGPPCASMAHTVNGSFTHWSEWSQCSASCGQGSQSRSRNCSNTDSHHGGANCHGDYEETQDCEGPPCASMAHTVNGNFTHWSEWSQCSASCGQGSQSRSRNCSNTDSHHGGANCHGDYEETQDCEGPPCASMAQTVNGSFTHWSEWSHCSASCGQGRQFRSRNCSNTDPHYGGANCHGDTEETQDCEGPPCPSMAHTVNGNFTHWSEWSHCSASCGQGSQSRSRNCSNTDPHHGGANCHGDYEETQDCEGPPCASMAHTVNGSFTHWSEWSQCSASCGQGSQSRSRNCSNTEPHHGWANCHGDYEETQDCEGPPCASMAHTVNGSFTHWSEWSQCSASCGQGSQSRSRNCSNTDSHHGGANCHGDTEETQDCEGPPCAMDGGYTDWSEWSQCSVSCGQGSQSRSRNCSNPAPQNGGADCDGIYEEMQDCEELPCAINGSFTHWSEWSYCSASCGQGSQSRSRNCSDTDPQHGGANCHGDYEETQECEGPPCASMAHTVNGSFTHWSEWSYCSASCGQGSQSRSRNCSNTDPQHGGANCHGDYEETRECEGPPCASMAHTVNGSFTHWSEWSHCSASCGQGSQSRSLNCSNTDPHHGGANCHGDYEETQECEGPPCASMAHTVNGSFTHWSEWSHCSASCGQGSQSRSRNCSNTDSHHGGANCHGDYEETQDCEGPPCASMAHTVNGSFTHWSEWSHCSASCGQGSQSRSRNCSNTDSHHGGANCHGDYEETQGCEGPPCASMVHTVNGSFTHWSEWSHCSASCGQGSQSRSRNCSDTDPQHGGANCHGDYEETQECEGPPCASMAHRVNGSFTHWSEWSHCSASCGQGSQSRSRNCSNTDPHHSGANCHGDYEETQECEGPPCASMAHTVNGSFTHWSEWSHCSASCGQGSQSRSRNCSNTDSHHGGANCHGDYEETQDCEGPPCASMAHTVNGSFTHWSEWSHCSASCGQGSQSRSRNCSNTDPQHGGANCHGDYEETQECEGPPCASMAHTVNGSFTHWSEWSNCSASCGQGSQSRSRNCSNTDPHHGGANCHGDYEETQDCEGPPCASMAHTVNGSFTHWSEWSHCSASCGQGSQSRSRNCSNTDPHHGGAKCHGDYEETQECEGPPCASMAHTVNGSFTHWSEWSHCSASCGQGSQSRSRNCSNTDPHHGGANCHGDYEETQDCEGPPCASMAHTVKCGPYPPPTTINSWALNKTIHVKMKEELSKPYGYCWIHKNFAIQNLFQYNTHCRFETWSWLTVNSQSKARKLAKFGQAARASLNSDQEYKNLFDRLQIPLSSRNYTSDLICLDAIEYNETMKTHVWTHSKQEVSFQAFDPTDIVYKGNSCVSFNMTSEKWRFDPWCIHLCTPVCQQKGPGITFPNEQPDNMPIYTPPNFEPAKCSGNFTDKTPTHSELQHLIATNFWRFYPDEKFGFGYLFPNGYGYCWALHMSKQINEDEGSFLKCGDLYPHSRGVAASSKMKVEKLSNYGRGMQEHILSKGITMETGRLSSVVNQDDQLVWESTGQPVNWTLFASDHNHAIAKEMVCPYISWKQRTLHSAGGICTGDVLICEQMGHDYPDETTVVQGFTEWSEWSSCQASCGQGVQVKSRECMGSYVCEGKAREVTNCTAGPCPVNGSFTHWSEWSHCSASCGQGSQSRSRNCSNTDPHHGGANCHGDYEETQDCEGPPCAINGSFTHWSEWSHCSASCGQGSQSRSRNCSNTDPHHGGANCHGDTKETQDCEGPPCAINGSFTHWSEWSHCSASCGRGSQSRSRNCSNTDSHHGGANCHGDYEETQDCKGPPCASMAHTVNGSFTHWSEWSHCSASCGRGSQSRSRNCSNTDSHHGGVNCHGDYEETQDCKGPPCAINGSFTHWSEWSHCSASCGQGSQSRSRNCSNTDSHHGGANCHGDYEETQDCEGPPCASMAHTVNGSFTHWSEWSHCSASCGQGSQSRSRNCSNTNPHHSGANCHGDTEETQECEGPPCAIDGGYTDWSEWSQCSASCGHGSLSRSRNCSNPAPQHGGANCLGDYKESQECEGPPCAIDGGYTDWSEWSHCSATCGQGSQSRSRNCSNPVPKHGADCHGDNEETQNCEGPPCAIDGGYTDWSEWSQCSASCGHGSLSRSRNCSNPAPQHGGANCLSDYKESQECEGPPCAIDGGFTDWSHWSKCSASCGVGSHSRSRNCSNPAPQNGGTDCKGDRGETQDCERQPCAIDGGYTDWSEWSPCSASCGQGSQSRSRDCSNPVPQHGGNDCDDVNEEKQACDSKACPIDGGYTVWSPWGECSTTCESGSQTRSRDCTNPVPQNGGAMCEGLNKEKQRCNRGPCPVHGGFTEWTQWTTCSASCDLGSQSRSRKCTNPAPIHGGKSCEGVWDETVECQMEPCEANKPAAHDNMYSNHHPDEGACNERFTYFEGRCLFTNPVKSKPGNFLRICNQKKGHRAVITSKEDAETLARYVQSFRRYSNRYLLSPLRLHNGEVTWASTGQNAEYVFSLLDIKRTMRDLANYIPVLTSSGRIERCPRTFCRGKGICQQRDSVYYSESEYEYYYYYY